MGEGVVLSGCVCIRAAFSRGQELLLLGVGRTRILYSSAPETAPCRGDRRLLPPLRDTAARFPRWPSLQLAHSTTFEGKHPQQAATSPGYQICNNAAHSNSIIGKISIVFKGTRGPFGSTALLGDTEEQND